MQFRVGLGYDVHIFTKNRPLLLGGVLIDHPYGLLGHSDADVLLHAIIDAILGAAGLGDIGQHFPDTDLLYRNADSRELLKKAMQLIFEKGWLVNNIDATIIAESPKLMGYKDKMSESIAMLCDIDRDRVNIKATTNEKMGFVGREEGIAVHAVASLISS